MKRFYGEMLAASPTNQDGTETWAVFDTGGAHFCLHAIPEEIAKSIDIEVPPTRREESPVKLVFQVRDVELERLRLGSLGVQTL